MMALLDRYGRMALDVATAGTALGFAAAKVSTRLGFGITRGIASSAASLTGSALDIPFGGRLGASAAFGSTVSSLLTNIEHLVLFPLIFSESLTSASLVAVHTSFSALFTLFPGTPDAAFSLASFVSLVRKEWNEPALGESLPEQKFGVAEVAQALIAWGALQNVTYDWHVGRWRAFLHELPFHDTASSSEDGVRQRTASRVSITSDRMLGQRRGQLLTADITDDIDVETESGRGGEGVGNGKGTTPGVAAANGRAKSKKPSLPPRMRPLRQPDRELKHTLRRLSKMVLAGYGGASLLFFGVPLVPPPDASHPTTTSSSSNSNSNPGSSRRKEEEAALEAAVDASETQATGSGHAPDPKRAYSWWDVLLGRHDRDIFLQSAQAATSSGPTSPPSTATSAAASAAETAAAGAETAAAAALDAALGTEDERSPRYWVLTDHGRRQIVLVFRGTMSLNELAVDLACEPEEFEPASAEDDLEVNVNVAVGREEKSGAEEVKGRDFAYEGGGGMGGEFGAPSDNESSMPGGLPFPSLPPPRTRSSRSLHSHSHSHSSHLHPPPSSSSHHHAHQSRMRSPSFQSLASFRPRTYDVHGGMLRMARIMGQRGGPVHDAVRLALRANKGYELVMCGHSLGSGVAALLGMMWADPTTCLTVRASGLPIGRRVSVYCFGPPCLTDARLSSLSANLVTSFVYSHDVVSRLSLGSMRDMTRAAAWLCAAQAEGRDEGYVGVTRRALKSRAGFGGEGDDVWFLSVRKTLEANMLMTHLYPPGRVFWAVRASDVDPPRDKYAAPPTNTTTAAAAGPETTNKDKDADALRLFEVMDVEKVFGQIVFARDMLSAHMPHQYDKVLEELL